MGCRNRHPTLRRCCLHRGKSLGIWDSHRIEPHRLFDVAIGQHVLLGNQHIVENRDSVVLVEPAGQRKVERARCDLLVRRPTEAGYDNEILLVNEIAVKTSSLTRAASMSSSPWAPPCPRMNPRCCGPGSAPKWPCCARPIAPGCQCSACASAGSYWRRHTAAESVARIGLKSVVTPSKAMIGGWCPKVRGFSGTTTNGRTHREPPKSQETATPLTPSSCAALSLCSSIRSCTVTFLAVWLQHHPEPWLDGAPLDVARLRHQTKTEQHRRRERVHRLVSGFLNYAHCPAEPLRQATSGRTSEPLRKQETHPSRTPSSAQPAWPPSTAHDTANSWYPTLAANPSGYRTKQAAREPSTWATAPHPSH